MSRAPQPPNSQGAEAPPTIWQQLRVPAGLGFISGAAACPLTWFLFGTTAEAFFLMAAIGGACFGIPSLIVIISHLTFRADG